MLQNDDLEREDRIVKDKERQNVLKTTEMRVNQWDWDIQGYLYMLDGRQDQKLEETLSGASLGFLVCWLFKLVI